MSIAPVCSSLAPTPGVVRPSTPSHNSKSYYNAKALPKVLQALVDMGDSTHRGTLPLTLYMETYIDRCYVDEKAMRVNGVGILRDFF